MGFVSPTASYPHHSRGGTGTISSTYNVASYDTDGSCCTSLITIRVEARTESITDPFVDILHKQTRDTTKSCHPGENKGPRMTYPTNRKLRFKPSTKACHVYSDHKNKHGKFGK